MFFFLYSLLLSIGLLYLCMFSSFFCIIPFFYQFSWGRCFTGVCANDSLFIKLLSISCEIFLFICFVVCWLHLCLTLWVCVCCISFNQNRFIVHVFFVFNGFIESGCLALEQFADCKLFVLDWLVLCIQIYFEDIFCSLCRCILHQSCLQFNTRIRTRRNVERKR